VDQAVITAIIAAFAGVFGSFGVAWLNRPKTQAEKKLLNTNAFVASSAELREWVDDRVGDAKERADAAEVRANNADHRAELADAHAREADKRIDDCNAELEKLEALAIMAYGHIRKLNDTIRAMKGSPPPLPLELEELWEHGR
jgi:chromosome segregation ATPase